MRLAKKALLVAEYGFAGRQKIIEALQKLLGDRNKSHFKDVCTGFCEDSRQGGVSKLTKEEIDAIPAVDSWSLLAQLDTTLQAQIRCGQYAFCYPRKKAVDVNLTIAAFALLITQLAENEQKQQAASIVVLPGDYSSEAREELKKLMVGTLLEPTFHIVSRDGIQTENKLTAVPDHHKAVHIIMTGSLSHHDFLSLMKGSQYPVLVTGNRSLTEAFSLGKVPIWHKSNMAHLNDLHAQLKKLYAKHGIDPELYCWNQTFAQLLLRKIHSSNEELKKSLKASVSSGRTTEQEAGRKMILGTSEAIPKICGPYTRKLIKNTNKFSTLFESIPSFKKKMAEQIRWLLEE